jgi:hypothetical protein
MSSKQKSGISKAAGLIHELMLTSDKVGAAEAFYAALAHNEKLFRRVVKFVEDETFVIEVLETHEVTIRFESHSSMGYVTKEMMHDVGVQFGRSYNCKRQYLGLEDNQEVTIEVQVARINDPLHDPQDLVDFLAKIQNAGYRLAELAEVHALIKAGHVCNRLTFAGKQHRYEDMLLTVEGQDCNGNYSPEKPCPDCGATHPLQVTQNQHNYRRVSGLKNRTFAVVKIKS